MSEPTTSSNQSPDERDTAYRAAIAILQRHHDHTIDPTNQPSAVDEDQLAEAYITCVEHWGPKMRWTARRSGFTPTDIDLVVDDASVEFYEKVVRPGMFDPRKNEFYIGQRVTWRANDLYGKTRGRRLSPIEPGRDPGAEDEPLADNLDEMYLREQCTAAGIRDPRDTEILVLMIIQDLGWADILPMINERYPPPAGLRTLQNHITEAKKRLKNHLLNPGEGTLQ